MAVLTVLLPVGLLGLMLGLGRFEDLMLRQPPAAKAGPQSPRSHRGEPRSRIRRLTARHPVR